MKKIFLSVVVLFSLLMLTGCLAKEETLNCSMKSGEKNMNYSIVVKGNDIISFKYSEVQNYPDSNSAQLAYGMTKQTFAIFSVYPEIKTTIQVNGNTVSSSMDVDFVNLSEESLKTLNLEVNNTKEFKEYLDRLGYVCE